MENKSIQDILNTDVGAIVEQGKATQKKQKKQIAQKAATVLIVFLLVAGVAVGGIQSYRTYKYRQEHKQKIHEVETAIESIGTLSAESEQVILYAWRLYYDLDNDLKAYVKNYSLLKNAQEKYAMEFEIPELLEKILSERERCMTIGDYTALKKIVENADSIIQEPLVKMMLKTLFEEIISKGCTYKDVVNNILGLTLR